MFYLSPIYRMQFIFLHKQKILIRDFKHFFISKMQSFHKSSNLPDCRTVTVYLCFAAIVATFIVKAAQAKKSLPFIRLIEISIASFSSSGVASSSSAAIRSRSCSQLSTFPAINAATPLTR